jgi:hypothetical protein
MDDTLLGKSFSFKSGSRMRGKQNALLWNLQWGGDTQKHGRVVTKENSHSKDLY